MINYLLSSAVYSRFSRFFSFKSFKIVAVVFALLVSVEGWGQVTEHFSTWTSKASYTAALSQSGSGGTWTALAGAVIVAPSGAANGTGSTGYVQIGTSKILTLPNIASGGVGTVTIQARFSGSSGSFTVDKNINGGGWTTVSTFPSSSTKGIQFQSTVNDASANILLRFSNSSTRTLYVYDVVTTTYSASPSLSAATLPSALSTTYGIASATPRSATVTGSNLGANDVTATAQSGYEVSLDGTTGWGSSVTYTPSTGLVSSPVYVRFSATKAAATYNGVTCVVLTCAASGNPTANISTFASGNTVSTKALTVTASAQSKSFGNTSPTSGTLDTDFTVSGLVNSDAISGATLGYSGSPAGNLATAVAGTYTITPSVVTFSTGTGNYNPSYVTGSLTINAVAPGSPTIGTAVAGNASVDVPFVAPTSNGGSVITSYTATSSPEV